MSISHHHTSCYQALSCHDHSLYPTNTMNRRRFIQLASLGGGITLIGLATPWRVTRAEATHQSSPSSKTVVKPTETRDEHREEPGSGVATSHTAEALLLSCMDYRLIDDITRYMDGRGMTNQYDHIVLAGASLGALTNYSKEWNKTFWEHLKIATDLHHIKKVILMDHRDCGAYKVILKADFSKDPQMETRVHSKFLRDLMVEIHKRHPDLEVERIMMNLDGTVKKVT